MSAAHVEEVLAKDWVFSEEACTELWESLGLAMPYVQDVAEERPEWFPTPATVDDVGVESFEGYVAPLQWMAADGMGLGEGSVSWPESPFVPGRGDGFIGIWSRRTPGGPVERFNLSPGGEGKAMESFRALMEPTLLEFMQVRDFTDFVGRLDFQHSSERVCGRDIKWSAARFVIGRGPDFIGIWDREKTGVAIERFPSSDVGRTAAFSRVVELLGRHLMRSKRVEGLRKFGRSEAGRRRLSETEDMWTIFEPALWLAVEEKPDSVWRPPIPGDGPLFVYKLEGSSAAPVINVSFKIGALATADRGGAWKPPANWQDVPEEVPRNLLATVEWVLSFA